jgi:tetratricopeptide (TPR) repeat protein
MRHILASRYFQAAPVFAVCVLAVSPAYSQKSGSGSAGGANAPAASSPNIGSTGRGSYGSIPNTNTIPGPAFQRPIFLSGKVLFDDSSPANPNIRIERVCGGNTRLEGHTDSKGRFSFQLGQNSMVDTDASDSSPGDMFGRPTSPSPFGRAGGFGDRATDLWNCELRASYPGYRSDVVQLATRRSMDDPDVGVIVLHRLANVQGTTISATTVLAPKDAQKNYQKGVQLIEKGKFEEAEKRLQEATEIYPRYAVAWYALGQIQQRQGHSEDARKAYQAAITADSKFVSPYDQLALLSAQEGKWADAASFSKQAISLNPVEFPSSLWYNAVASYNLKRSADAEKSIKDLLKLDTRHKYPEAENMLAQILLDKGNYADAATHLRTYLTLVPNAKNADALKQMLLKIDQAAATPPKQ